MNKINFPIKFELIEGIDSLTEYGEATASINLNPNFQWAKIIVTDDKPNENKHRIPQEEFDNLIKTGVYAPIKMASLGQDLDHDTAMGKPIGAMAKFIKENNRLITLAALWKRERPDEITALKDMYVKGMPPQVSWEISYSEDSPEDNGVVALRNTCLDGITVVSNPAYAGRTPFTAMSSKKLEDKNVDELELAKAKISELENKIKELESSLAEKEASLSTASTELTELREFKNTVEKERADAERFKAIKQKFSDAKIEKDDTYFESQRQTLLAMEDSALDFMIQELTAFAEKLSATSSKNDGKEIKIPNIEGKEPKDLTPKELGQALRESKSKPK